MTSVPAPLFPVDPSRVKTLADLRALSATQLFQFKQAHPEAFARLSTGAPVDFSNVTTPEGARSLTASQLRDFAHEAPAQFASVTAVR